MLLRALQPFMDHPRVAQLVVALPTAFVADAPAWLADVTGERLRLVAGGAARADSVRAALAALAPRHDIVLVHDAARPFVSRDLIDAVVAVVERGVSAVPALPVSDTLKRATRPSMRVVETVARDGLWRAQTPQGFPRAVLDDAMRRTTRDAGAATDEASLVEAAGYVVELVPGQITNFKVTTAEDFVVADAVARR